MDALQYMCVLVHLQLLVIGITHTAAIIDSQDPSKECQHVFQVKKGQNLAFHLHNFTKSEKLSHYCTLEVSAAENMRIVLDLVYAPPRQNGKFPTDCSSDYVHVGNDIRRVDVDLITSYKFCREDVQHELVSRNNHMWLVYKASQKPEEFLVHVQAKNPVLCTAEQFVCSPVQCVDRSRVCDGIKDCNNGHDEFCHRVGVSSPHVRTAEPCFRCGDGTCIQPRLSQYDVSYGRVLWYLCDGFSHCPDAWDERKDICLGLHRGRVGSVTECVPFDLQFGHNGSVMMWNEIRCDDNPDCYHGDDERGCHDNESEGSKLHADPLTIGVVVGIVVTASLVAFVVYKIKTSVHYAARPSTTSTVDTTCTQCTTVDDDGRRMVADGQGCGRSSVDNGGTRCGHSNGDDPDEPHDQCTCSLTLKHTSV